MCVRRTIRARTCSCTMATDKVLKSTLWGQYQRRCSVRLQQSFVDWTGATRCCMVCRRTCRGRLSLCSTLPLVYSPTQGAVTTSHRCCVNYIRCQFRTSETSGVQDCLPVHQSLASKAPTYLTAAIRLISEHGLRSTSNSTLAEQSSYQRHCINFSTVFQEST